MATLPEEVDPQVWLAYAREDLAAAYATIGQVAFPRQSAYHSQQAAEKAPKAILILPRHPAALHP
jgi:HEPN domain-containing protein